MGRKLEPTYVVGGVTDEFGYRRGENAAGMTAEESKAWYKAQTPEEKAEIERQRDERRLREAKEREKQAWPATQAGQLLKQLGEAFAAYRECVAQNPQVAEKGLEFDELNQKIFNRMKNNMERAHQAARCRYPKTNGTTCRAPRVRGKKILPYAPDDGGGAPGKDQPAQSG